jgi:hypothetical protein
MADYPVEELSSIFETNGTAVVDAHQAHGSLVLAQTAWHRAIV